MNTSYLLSVLDLYLQKEKNSKIIVEVECINNIVKVNFSYSFDHTNKTFVKINKDDFLSCINNFIAKIQQNTNVTMDNYNYNKQHSTTYTFSNERRLSLINFQESDLKIINENISNLDNKIEVIASPVNLHAYDDIVIEDYEEESYDNIYQETKKTKLSFSFGFASYATLFIIAIWFLDILLIGLWIFKAMMK